MGGCTRETVTKHMRAMIKDLLTWVGTEGNLDKHDGDNIRRILLSGRGGGAWSWGSLSFCRQRRTGRVKPQPTSACYKAPVRQHQNQSHEVDPPSCSESEQTHQSFSAIASLSHLGSVFFLESRIYTKGNCIMSA